MFAPDDMMEIIPQQEWRVKENLPQYKALDIRGIISTECRPMTLLEKTKNLLQAKLDAGFRLAEIAESSDGTVEREWLYKFARDHIDDPSVNRIQSLHDHLRSLSGRDMA